VEAEYFVFVDYKLQSHQILDFILGSEKQIKIFLGLLMAFSIFIYFGDSGKFENLVLKVLLLKSVQLCQFSLMPLVFSSSIPIG
jgi:hypothetical protein